MTARLVLIVSVLVAVLAWVAMRLPENEMNAPLYVPEIIDSERGRQTQSTTQSAASSVDSIVSEESAPSAIDVSAPDPRESIESLWWPQSPELTEALVSQALSENISGIVTMTPVECTNTRCELQVTVTKDAPFLSQVTGNDLPLEMLEAGLSGINVERLDDAVESETFSVNFISYATVAFGTRQYTEDQLVRLPEESIIPCRGESSQPAILGTFQEVDVIQQCVCTYDCPNDARRIISLGVANGEACQQVGGVEQRILAETSLGMREETICSPAALAQ